MSNYEFYYDETEHSRKINYKTVSAANYYDNFVTMIVGWSSEKNELLQRHASFEEKYADRKDRNGEIKSTIFQQKQFRHGFASLNKQNAQFVSDFLSLFDEDIHIYFSVASKIEYLVLQLFHGYRNRFLVDTDLMKYSITKALVMYRPKEIIKCLYESPEDFLEHLKKFFRDRINCNWSYVKKKYKLNVTNFLCSERSLTCYFYCILLDVFKILFLIFIWRQISTMTVNAHGIVKCFDVFKNQFMCMCIIKDFKPVDPFSLQKCMERFYTGVIPWICFL